MLEKAGFLLMELRGIHICGFSPVSYSNVKTEASIVSPVKGQFAKRAKFDTELR